LVVIKVSTAGTKIPTVTRMPSIAKMRNPNEANAILISFIFLRDNSEMMLMSIDNPQNESLRNISSWSIEEPS